MCLPSSLDPFSPWLGVPACQLCGHEWVPCLLVSRCFQLEGSGDRRCKRAGTSTYWFLQLLPAGSAGSNHLSYMEITFPGGEPSPHGPRQASNSTRCVLGLDTTLSLVVSVHPAHTLLPNVFIKHFSNWLGHLFPDRLAEAAGVPLRLFLGEVWTTALGWGNKGKKKKKKVIQQGFGSIMNHIWKNLSLTWHVLWQRQSSWIVLVVDTQVQWYLFYFVLCLIKLFVYSSIWRNKLLTGTWGFLIIHNRFLSFSSKQVPSHWLYYFGSRDMVLDTVPGTSGFQ